MSAWAWLRSRSVHTFTQWSELDPLVFKAYTVDPIYGQPTSLVTLEPAYNEAGELVAVRTPPHTATTAAPAMHEPDEDFVTLTTEQTASGGTPKLTQASWDLFTTLPARTRITIDKHAKDPTPGKPSKSYARFKMYRDATTKGGSRHPLRAAARRHQVGPRTRNDQSRAARHTGLRQPSCRYAPRRRSP